MNICRSLTDSEDFSPEQNHGVVVSPEISTNGDTGRGGAEDDITADSVSRLAQESSHDGRESVLGMNQLNL